MFLTGSCHGAKCPFFLLPSHAPRYDCASARLFLPIGIQTCSYAFTWSQVDRSVTRITHNEENIHQKEWRL